jgi:hypothetical protein
MAFNPSQADSVILLRWTKDVVGHFPSGDASYRNNCEVVVVDVAAKAVVGRIALGGGPAPTSKPVSVRGDAGGEGPDREIVAWIKALPRR